MANLVEITQWEDGIRQIELDDDVEGGLNGVDNTPHIQIANRTAYLKSRQDNNVFKQPVRAASIANLNLSGLQTVDGVVLQAGDRVLVKNQALAATNGIYVIAESGWSRAADADSNDKMQPGQVVIILEGNTQADTMWLLTTDVPIVLNSTELQYENEIFTARGSKASLDARLDVALNEDGTLKSGADTEVAAARGNKVSLDARLDVTLNEDGTLKSGADAEVVAARGNKVSLDARLDVALNEDGGLKTHAIQAVLAEDASTNSANWSAIGNGLSIILTVGGSGIALISVSIAHHAMDVSAWGMVRINRDNGQEIYHLGRGEAGVQSILAGRWLFANLAAGDHVFEVEWKKGNGAGVHCNAASNPEQEQAVINGISF